MTWWVKIENIYYLIDILLDRKYLWNNKREIFVCPQLFLDVRLLLLFIHAITIDISTAQNNETKRQKSKQAQVSRNVREKKNTKRKKTHVVDNPLLVNNDKRSKTLSNQLQIRMDVLKNY